MTEPNLDKEIDKALEELVYCGRDTFGVTDEAVLARKAIKELIANQVREARINELTIGNFGDGPGSPDDEYVTRRIAELKGDK